MKKIFSILNKNYSESGIFTFLLTGYEVINYLSIDAYLPAMPAIANEFGVSNQTMQLTLTIFFLGNIIAQLIIGKLSIKYGRRTILLRGAGFLFIATTLLSILSTNISTLFIARFFQGAAVTFFIISGYSTVHALYSQKKAVKIIAWMSSISIFSPVLGPLLGAFILQISSWRWIFVVLLILASIYLAGLSRFMPETNENLKSEKQRDIFKYYWQTIKNWQFMKPAIAWCALYSVMVSWGIVSPFFVIKNAHYDAIHYGLIQAFVLSAFIAGNRLVGYFLERYSLKYISTISARIAGIAGILGFLLNHLFPDQLFAIILFILPLNFSLGLGFAVFNRLAIENSTKPLSIKVSLTSLLVNLAAFLTSTLVTMFFSQNIFRYSLYLFILSLIAFFCGYYRKNNTIERDLSRESVL
ncbi:MAG: MFS transporter [Proteobacteria bacterium]|nr:MFS transporter [Pseudomonadota bacterium]